MKRDRPSWIVAACVLGALIAAAYGASIDNALVFDDAIFMERDSRVRSFEAARDLLIEPLWGFQDAPGRSGIHQYYRPLQLLPLIVANEWFAGDARPCHAISLAMHFLISMLAFALIAKATQHRWAALFCASIFAVHPGGSEAVLWVSDFAGLGVALATLGVLLVHAGRRFGIAAMPICAALALFGMFCKESGVLILPTMVAWDLLIDRESAERRGDPPRTLRARTAAYLGVGTATVAYLILRGQALGGMLPGASRLELGGLELLLNAVALLPSYVATFALPIDLNMYHDFEIVRSWREPRFAYGCAITGAWALALITSYRRNRAAAFGLIFAAIAVAPYLLVRWPQLNAYAERYTYLPSVGLLLAGATLFADPHRLILARRAAAAAAVVTILWFITIDRSRTVEWRDEISIYEKTLTQSPRAELIRNNLALRYLSEGKPKPGIALLERLLEIDPDFRSGWHNLGLLYLADDQRDRAREAFERAVESEPMNATSWLNLGYVRDASGMRIQAIDAYFRALDADPTETKAMYNLAVIALEMGQPRNAIEALEALNATQAAAPQGERDDAVTALLARARAQVRRDPTPAMTQALARQLARGRHAVEAGHWRRGEAALRTASWIDERAHLPHHFLANGYYLRGRHEQALHSERAALARAPQNPLYKKNVAALEALASGQRDADSDPAPPQARFDSHGTSSDLEAQPDDGEHID